MGRGISTALPQRTFVHVYFHREIQIFLIFFDSPFIRNCWRNSHQIINLLGNRESVKLSSLVKNCENRLKQENYDAFEDLENSVLEAVIFVIKWHHNHLIKNNVCKNWINHIWNNILLLNTSSCVHLRINYQLVHLLNMLKNSIFLSSGGINLCLTKIKYSGLWHIYSQLYKI